MSYYSDPAELKSCGIDLDEAVSFDDAVFGCVEPTAEYGEGGIETFETYLKRESIDLIPEVEWAERLELMERGRGFPQHRMDADLIPAGTQGRCGYCWAYALIKALEILDASSSGRKVRRYSAASIAAQIKNGKDQGGWPVEAAKFIQEHGVGLLEEWGDCSCKGSSCKGPRSGCPARDLSLVDAVKDSASKFIMGDFYELPRDSMAASLTALFKGLPIAAGWVNTGAWCDGHAMVITRPIRTRQRGWQLVPDNSWGEYKRRTPVSKAPKGGVVVTERNTIK